MMLRAHDEDFRGMGLKVGLPQIKTPIVLLYSTLLEVAFLRVKKWSMSFAGGRRSSHRFPTVAIRRSLPQTFGVQLHKINRC